MLWSLIFSRMWRGYREMLMLLLALSLVTGFFALGPLYLRVLGESALRYTINTARPRDLTLSLISESLFDLTDRPVVTDQLGAVASGVETRMRMNGIVCNGNMRSCLGDEYFRAYVPSAYERLTERFEVADGAYPQAPDELAISANVAERTNLEVGDTISFYPDTVDERVFQITGILTPDDPDDPFWMDQTVILSGQLVDVTDNFQRYDMGVIFNEDVYNAHIAPFIHGDTRNEWYVEINTDALRAENLNELTWHIETIERWFRLDHADLLLASGLYTLLLDFRSALSAIEGTIILFAAGILLLLFYQLMMTTALILERHSAEWSSMVSRGGSTTQLGMMQAATMTIIALAAFLLGVPIAIGIVILLERSGPLSHVLGPGLNISTIPPFSFVLSGVAALAAIVALTLPAIPAARSSLLRLKQSISRPPTTPLWARFYLDFVLIGLAVVLLLRLYFVFGGTSVEELLADPSTLLHIVSVSAAHETGLLDDPFNLAIPALLITGFALLWIRLFPLIMNGLGALFNRTTGLIAPLAFWSIARDPGHYAQLVMMLIGTLAIGTASLALAATHDVGSWNTAQNMTGADVALTFDGEAVMLQDFSGEQEILARYVTIEPSSLHRTTLLGLSDERFAELAGQPMESPSHGGFELPADTLEVSMQVYAEPLPGQHLSTRLALDAVNTMGVLQSIPFVTQDDSVTGRFVPYVAALPDDRHLPYTIVGIRLLSSADSDVFEHTIYIDDIRYSIDDGTTEILDDFERSSLPEWTSAGQPAYFQILPSRSISSEGDASLRVSYRIATQVAQRVIPVVPFMAPPIEPAIPVILSQQSADAFGALTQRRNYSIGDTGTAPLELPEGERDFRFQVAGIIPSFPMAEGRFVLARSRDLLPWLNAGLPVNGYYAENTLWLTLPDRQLDFQTQTQIEALTGLLNVDEAWLVYNQLLREPLPNAIIGVLFAGFWVSLTLGLLNFAFYLATTSARRATSFAVLRAQGLSGLRVWGLLTTEQAALILPALVIGVLLGIVLASFLRPFLVLLGGEALAIPAAQIGGLLAILLVSFTVLLVSTAIVLARRNVGQVLRIGEE